MRRLVICNIMSLDGYYEGPGNNVMPLFSYRADIYPLDESFDEYNAERLRAADTLLLGRVSFEGFRSYWPSVADNTAAAPIEREISRLNDAIQKVVVSDSLTPDGIEPWHNTRVIKRNDAHLQISELKRQAGRDIVIFGSRTLWNDLLVHDLADELHLMVCPVVLGAGTPLFDSRKTPPFRLIDTRTWDGSGNILARYDVRRHADC